MKNKLFESIFNESESNSEIGTKQQDFEDKLIALCKEYSKYVELTQDFNDDYGYEGSTHVDYAINLKGITSTEDLKLDDDFKQRLEDIKKNGFIRNGKKYINVTNIDKFQFIYGESYKCEASLIGVHGNVYAPQIVLLGDKQGVLDNILPIED